MSKEAMAGCRGIPLGIQVSTLPYEDEKLMGVSQQFDKGLQFRRAPLNKHNEYK